MKLHVRFKNIVKIATKSRPPKWATDLIWLEGSNLVASDGKRIVVLPVELDEGDIDGFISQAAITAACKAKSPRADDSRVLFAGTELRAPLANYSEPRPAPDGQFPPYQKVLPTFKEGDSDTVTVRLNAQMLVEMAALLSDTSCVSLTFKLGLPRKSMDVDQPGTTDMTQAQMAPVLVRGTLADDYGMGALMPIEL